MTLTAASRAVGVLVLALTLVGCTGEPEPHVTVDPAAYARELFDGTNAEREAAGLDPLVWKDCVAEVAVERAQVVAETDTLEHQPLQAPCAENATAGENLSYAGESAQEIVSRWMDSPGHAANILTEAFVDGAVGCVADGDKTACSWVAQGAPVSLD